MDNPELDAVDLISLLTEPGMEGIYEIEISDKSILDETDDVKPHSLESISNEPITNITPSI